MKTFLFLVGVITLSWGSSTVSGSIFDKHTLKPLENAIIISHAKEYRTNAKGEFSVPSDEKLGIRAVGYNRKFCTEGGKIYLERFIPKALYLSSYGAKSSILMGNAKKLLKNTEINSLVIDVKMDRGQIAMKASNPIAAKIGAQELILFKDMPKFIADLHAEGIYVIARIVSFKDSNYVSAHPEHGVKKTNGSLFYDKEHLNWIDASKKAPRNYIISIAEDAAKAGFDEIQFDYVRFPDTRGVVFSVENTQANRVKAISGFLEQARNSLTKYNVFISADVFGYVAWHNADIQIGQRVDAISPYVDYISPMLYPSGFSEGIPGFKNPVEANYEIVKQSLDKSLAKSLAKSDTSSLNYRPWLQAFRDYAFDKRIYGAKEIREQINGAEDFGSCGWILWNPRNVYTDAGLKKS